MNHTLPLLVVPRTKPSKAQRITAFKRQHGIVTYRSPGMIREDLPWIAVLMIQARQLGYGVTQQDSIGEVMSKVGRLVDEGNMSHYATGELSAIRGLCASNGIMCDL